MTDVAPIASTKLGRLEGAWSDRVAVFRGVPYAAPPVGGLRFLPPAPVEPWTSLRDARHHGPIAPQLPSRLRLAMGDFTRPQSEDCLTLTIWTPAPDPGAGRPVLVWLHGGAFMSGAGSLDFYDGAVLAREGGIVVVGVNYRLGALGFLHHPSLDPPNPGLADQLAALAWIAAHIAEFGGDPAAVTIMGQSAGGGSIAYLLTRPEARPLFRRAILQSAALYPPLPVEQAASRAMRLCDLLGIDGDGTNFAEELRAAEVAPILEAQGKLAREIATVDPLALPFCPVGDASLGPDAYLARIAEGAEAKEIMIGWTREEMHGFYAADPALQRLDAAALAQRSQAIAGDPRAIDAYRAQRPDGSAMDLLADFVTDHRFVQPAQRLAAMIAERGGKVWTYRFDWAGPRSIFKACHCIELPFLFGTEGMQRQTAPMLAGGDALEMAVLGRTLRRAWVSFVRDGVPVTPGTGWPAQDGARSATLGFDRTIGLVNQAGSAASQGHAMRGRLDMAEPADSG